MDHDCEFACLPPAFRLNVRMKPQEADAPFVVGGNDTNRHNRKGFIASCISGILHLWHLEVACIEVGLTMGQYDFPLLGEKNNRSAWIGR